MLTAQEKFVVGKKKAACLSISGLLFYFVYLKIYCPLSSPLAGVCVFWSFATAGGVVGKLGT